MFSPSKILRFLLCSAFVPFLVLKVWEPFTCQMQALGSPQQIKEEEVPRQPEGERKKAIEVAELEKYDVRQIEFLGNYTTRDSIVRRRLVTNEGFTFSVKDIEQSLKQINRLRLFLPIHLSDVDFHLDTEHKQVDMTIHMTEHKPKAHKRNQSNPPKINKTKTS